MKQSKVNFGILLVVISSLSMAACKNGGKENAADAAAEENHATMDHSSDNQAHQMMEMEESASNLEQDNQAGQVVAQYLVVKDALVSDDVEATAKAGERLFAVLGEFKVEEYEDGQQQELTEIVEDSKEHAEHISMSDIAHQREHFLTLSQNMLDMVEITGAPQGLYEQYCPMYNDNRGGSWLSTNEEVRNPYFGAQMLTCGKVQREI